jgi:hypothetical protein
VTLTPEQHAQRLRQLELQLEIADYGMGMPRDYQRVKALRVALEYARKEARAAVLAAWPAPRMDSDYAEGN